MDAPLASLRARLQLQLEDGLAFVLERATPEALVAHPEPGKWSALENLAHLARHHEVFLERIERILREDRPSLDRYRAEQDPAWPAWQTRDADSVLAGLRELRSRLVARLAAASVAEMARTAVHPRFGEMSLLGWTEFFLLHEAHHLYVALGRVGAARSPA
jgi:DinB superfamily